MPVNRNALLRYKTIDSCLKNRYRQWTLEDLIDACSDALYEYEGIDKGISRRTVQADIQMMRSEKLGYNAPIVVYDNKYYTYEDRDYSITNTPLSEQDLKVMSEAVEVLRQFKEFSYFSDMGEIVNRLEDHVSSAKTKSIPVIDFEKNNNLKGLNHLDTIYKAIVDKIALQMSYQSYKARSASSFIFYPYLLKEYKNRWFIFGLERGQGMLKNLALDRIQTLEFAKDEKYRENNLFDPSTFFDDIVGVTKNINQRVERVIFVATTDHAQYINTKPIHSSQKIVELCEDGSIVFEIKVIINQELQRELLGFGDGIRIMSPRSLVKLMARKLRNALQLYENAKDIDSYS